MRHLVGIGVLVAIAFLLQFWLHTNLGLDIVVHNTYWVVPLSVIAFWCLMATALVWLLVVAWVSIHRR
jgi:hypothetical protein